MIYLNSQPKAILYTHKDDFESELSDVGQYLPDVSLAGQPLPEPQVHQQTLPGHQRQLWGGGGGGGMVGGTTR